MVGVHLPHVLSVLSKSYSLWLLGKSRYDIIFDSKTLWFCFWDLPKYFLSHQITAFRPCIISAHLPRIQRCVFPTLFPRDVSTGDPKVGTSKVKTEMVWISGCLWQVSVFLLWHLYPRSVRPAAHPSLIHPSIHSFTYRGKSDAGLARTELIAQGRREAWERLLPREAWIR